MALMAGKAEVKYDPTLLEPSRIVQLISDLGFQARAMEENAVQDGTLDLSVSAHVCDLWSYLTRHLAEP